jgi:hypothetical protein
MLHEPQATSPYYQIAYLFAMQTNRSLFLTGKAGTGKTTFLKKLKEESPKGMAVVAPTGVAAINAGGVTIHSFFQLPLTPFVPTDSHRKEWLGKLKINSSRRRLLHDLEILVIDEISMVRADVLDAMDTILRHFRYRRNEPFGGVQVIFIGDMYQLAPVYKDEEWYLLSPYYRSMYFFDSHVLRQQQPVYIEFDTLFRQSDTEFIHLLNEVRNNRLSPQSLAMLQSRYQPDFRPSDKDNYVTLTTHNYMADAINNRELAKLKGKTQTFAASIRGDYPEKSYPTEKVLECKLGAKVMFLKNDKESPRRYFNGKIGEIVAFEEDCILVQCPGDEFPIAVEPEQWENISYSTDPSTKQIRENVTGSFEQYPLRLAWAITIHKSQGLTFDRVVIDAGKAFAPGQVYVALSRCRSLDGVVLLSPINQRSLQTDAIVVEHGRQKLPLEYLRTDLQVAMQEFRNTILLSLFDLKTLGAQNNRLLFFVKENETSFNGETVPFLQGLQQRLAAIQNIALRFQQELQRLTAASPVDESHLQLRIASAADYFSAQLQVVSDELKRSPAITDSKANAAEYNEGLQNIFSGIAEKCHLFTHLRQHFSVEEYYFAKSQLVVPPFAVNAFAGSSTPVATTKARFPQLFYRLMDLRRNICDSSGLPLYLVSSTKGLTELATYLPQSLGEMKQISGFGKTTIARYGQQFLDVVLDYCRENSLQSLIHEKQPAPKKRKTKR